MEVITKNAEETKSLGKSVGSLLREGDILALTGDLGSGKTTFVQGLTESLGIMRVISPTFILMRKYELTKRSFYHLDLYRLEEDVQNELKNLGFLEIVAEKNAIIVVEWADKARNIFPSETMWINFKEIGDDRIITVPDNLKI